MAARLWSRCRGCGQHEWNDVLERSGRSCSKCHRTVRLHVSRSKSPGTKRVSFEDQKAPQGDPGVVPKTILKSNSAVSEVGLGALEHLASAIKVTHGPVIKHALQLEYAKLESLRVREAADQDTAAEAVRKADAAWRDADTKHSQAVAPVTRLRGLLSAAEIKEQAAALHLANAAAVKQAAARRLAQAEGVVQDGTSSKLFHLSWDESLFADVAAAEELDEAEKQHMASLEAQLKEAKANLCDREEETRGWLDRDAELRKAIEDRKLKKRMVNGQAEATKLPAAKYAVAEALK
ncbi:unnamed protein product [Prorocentrum cordatum]|uniref:Uncharacterized protein n=1 Tax=Prorocentrum cordatum TaxID=2364126 RepID=A0ABN9XAM1_9DINO|nr:unnamed protein product [Polarella glacialis]